MSQACDPIHCSFCRRVLKNELSGSRANFTVRRITAGIGIERVFPLHSPLVESLEVTRYGNVRRAKLFYLRDRVGKKTRVKELLGEKVRQGRAVEKARRENLANQEVQAAAADQDADQEAVEA